MRAVVMQHLTQRPVQFDILQAARDALLASIKQDFLSPSRLDDSPHMSPGSMPGSSSTRSTLIYRRTKNLRAVQLLLGRWKLESTLRYRGVEFDDALEVSEQTEV